MVLMVSLVEWIFVVVLWFFLCCCGLLEEWLIGFIGVLLIGCEVDL